MCIIQTHYLREFFEVYAPKLCKIHCIGHLTRHLHDESKLLCREMCMVNIFIRIKMKTEQSEYNFNCSCLAHKLLIIDVNNNVTD